MANPPNRRSPRKAARKVRRGKTIKPLSRTVLKAEAERVLSRTQLSAVTMTAWPLSGDEAADLGRRIAELTSAIESLPEGSPEQRELVVEQIVAMNTLQNGVRYANTVQRRVDHLMDGEPGPIRPAEPNDTSPGADYWRSAGARYHEQTAFAHGLAEACASVLGRPRAFAFALDVLHTREGHPVSILSPAQMRVAASDSLYRDAMQQMAARRWAFDAAVENTTLTEILRRANGEDGANLIDPGTIDHWRRDTDARDLALDEQVALRVRDGTVATLPPALQIRLLQLRELDFPGWVRLALRRD